MNLFINGFEINRYEIAKQKALLSNKKGISLLIYHCHKIKYCSYMSKIINN